MLITLLAAWLLHETVSPLRWALVGGGLVGALLVIRPGSGLFGVAVLFPLAGVCTYAAYQVLTSRMSSLDNPYTTHFWTGLIGMLLVTPLLLLDGADMWAAASAANAGQWSVMLLIAVLGTAGHLLLILALGMAPTSTLMPFIYTQIPIAVGLSWLVFRQWPDALAWLGMAVISACGATAAWLNLRSRPAAAAALARGEGAAGGLKRLPTNESTAAASGLTAVQNRTGQPLVRASPVIQLVGTTGFEPATPCPPDKCATKLRYAPTEGRL